MAAEAADLEFVATDTEAEALLLENNWIKQQQPRYNILLRDDKTYPYLKLTVAEEWPRLVFTRRIGGDGAAYFGPFLPGGLARRATKLVQKLFKVRVCRIPIDGSLPRPCLYYDMRRCLGPCVAGLTTHEEYRDAVEQARLFLAGRTDELVRRLRRDMEAAAEALEFERAAAAARPARRRRGGAGAAEARLGARRGRRRLRLPRRRRQRHGGDPGDARRPGARPPRAVLGRGGAGRPRAPASPSCCRRSTPPPPSSPRRSTCRCRSRASRRWRSGSRSARTSASTCASPSAARRRSGCSWRCTTRSSRTGAASAARSRSSPARWRWPVTSASPSRRSASKGSTSRTSRAARRWRRWWCGRRGRCASRTTAASTCATSSGPTTRPRSRRRSSAATSGCSRRSAPCPTWCSSTAAARSSTPRCTRWPSWAWRRRRWWRSPSARRRSTCRRARRRCGCRARTPACRLLQQVRDEAHRFAVSRHRRRRQKRTLVSRLDQLAGVGPGRRRMLLQRFGSFGGVQRATREELQAALGAAPRRPRARAAARAAAAARDRAAARRGPGLGSPRVRRA